MYVVVVGYFVMGLPGAIDQERVDARYDQGLLRITFLKTQANAR